MRWGKVQERVGIENREWRVGGERKGRRWGLAFGIAPCYHCRSGRDLGSASQDGEVGGIVLIMATERELAKRTGLNFYVEGEYCSGTDW